jgi:hypothetical protein
VGRKRRRLAIGTPGWVSCVELANLEHCHRVTAWRIMLTLQATHGEKNVHVHGRRWRARTEVVTAYFKAKAATPDERIDAIERKVGQLVREIEERDARIDRLASELREARDRFGYRRA